MMKITMNKRKINWRRKKGREDIRRTWKEKKKEERTKWKG